jgi:hypothetical protein
MTVKKAGDCGLPRWEGLTYIVSEGSVLKHFEYDAIFNWGSCRVGFDTFLSISYR